MLGLGCSLTSNPWVVKLSWLTNAYSRPVYRSAIWTSKVGQGDLVRPPDIHVSGLIFYHGFFFFLSFFLLCPLISELAERNSTKIGHMVGSKCNSKTHVQNLGCPFPSTNRGPKNHLFVWLRNLTANLTAYIFGTKRDIDNRSSACKLQGVFYIDSKRHELWSTKGLKLDCSFHPPSVNSALHFIARLSRRRSANGTQPNFVTRWTVGRANNLP